MKFKINNIEIIIDYTFIISILLSIISKTFFSIFICYLINYIFIVFHEFSHLMVANFFKVKLIRINILGSGMFLDLDSLKKIKKINRILIFLAGPICNLFLSILLKRYYIFSYINIFLFLLNLLPLKNFDGYNIFKEFLNINILNNISKFIFFIFICLNLILIINYNNYNFIIILIYYYIQNLKKNTNE